MEKETSCRCQAIKKNGKPCKQSGKPRQNGGPIIDGYCKYHRHLRNKDPSNDPNFLTTMN
tara:strand:- start:1381 stop:1560 length:180 start_codon:yes stop_codon:yes gene_type:complete